MSFETFIIYEKSMAKARAYIPNLKILVLRPKGDFHKKAELEKDKQAPPETIMAFKGARI